MRKFIAVVSSLLLVVGALAVLVTVFGNNIRALFSSGCTNLPGSPAIDAPLSEESARHYAEYPSGRDLWRPESAGGANASFP